MDKEKKKLILVAVSVGVFLVIAISTSILIITPKSSASSAGGASFSSARPITPGSAGTFAGQPASIDALDAVRNSGDIQGLQTPPANAETQGAGFYISGEERTAASESGGSPNITFDVPRPSTAAVPDVPVENAARPRASEPAAAKPAVAASAKPAAPKPAAAKPAAAKPAATAAAKPAQTKHNDYWVQTGAFTAKVRAEGVKETLSEKGITSIIENREVDGKTWYRVRVGPYTSETEANYWLALVKSIDGFADSQVRQTVSMR